MSNFKNNSTHDTAARKWPADCLWPEPLWDGQGFGYWEVDDVESTVIDEEMEDLLDIKTYMDELIEEGRLNEDYSLNEDYFPDEGEPDPFEPEKGIDFWEDGFDLEGWQDALSEHMDLLKIPAQEPSRDAVSIIRGIIDYEFINENLLRQAFTRRAFGLEYGVGDSEILEFLGDTVLNMIVTREMICQFSEDYSVLMPQAPFKTSYSEGEMTKIRTHYISGEYLAERASELGLDRFVLYGTGEKMSSAALEDMMEALIGAVTIDSKWDWSAIVNVVDRLLCVQLMKPDSLLKATFFDIFNAWHQRHFGKFPSYEVYGDDRIQGGSKFWCTLRFQIPENRENLPVYQRVDEYGPSRSKVRENAARAAYAYVMDHSLWIDLSKSGIEPKLEDSINQLQELYQKKYLDSLPVYTFEEAPDGCWICDCICGGISGYGRGESKTKAKKQAAYMVLQRLFR